MSSTIRLSSMTVAARYTTEMSFLTLGPASVVRSHSVALGVSRSRLSRYPRSLQVETAWTAFTKAYAATATQGMVFNQQLQGSLYVTRAGTSWTRSNLPRATRDSILAGGTLDWQL